MLIKTKLLIFLRAIILCLSISHCLQASQYQFDRLTPRTEFQKNLLAMPKLFGHWMRVIDDPLMPVVQRRISAERALQTTDEKMKRYKTNYINRSLRASAKVQKYQQELVGLYQAWSRAQYNLVEGYEFSCILQLALDDCSIERDRLLSQFLSEEKRAFSQLMVDERSALVKILPNSRTNDPYAQNLLSKLDQEWPHE